MLESHFADCRGCRQQVVSARRLLKSFSARRSLTWALPAAAAAALVWLLIGPRRDTGDAERGLFRGRDRPAGSEAPATLAVIAPPNDGSVARAQVEFIWQGRAGQPLFRLTLAEGSRELWSATTRDTTLRPPPSVSLASGQTYLWSVDALDADGRSVTSGTKRFVVRP